MSGPKEPPSTLTPSDLREIAWGAEHGLLEGRRNRAVLKAIGVGAGTPWMKAMLLEDVQGLRMRGIQGELEPFREPQLHEGELLLGMSSLGNQIRVPRQTPASGMLVMMPSGQGKTNFFRFLLPQFPTNDVAVWIFEQEKTESRHLLPFFPPGERGLVIVRPQTSKYEPMHPGNSDRRSHLTNVATVITQGFDLGERSHAVIYQICDALFEKFGSWNNGRVDAHPNYFDVYEGVKTTRGIMPAVRESILDRMAPTLLWMKPWRLGWSPADLSSHSICFEMTAAPKSLKHIIPESLIRTVFQAEIEKGAVNAPLRLVVVFEDAQAYVQQSLNGMMTPLDIAAGTVRGAGLGVGVSCQTLEGFSKSLIPNLTGFRMMGRPGSNDDAFRMGSNLGLDREAIEWTKTGAGHGVYVANTNQWPHAFVNRIPLIPLQRHVSDEEADASVSALDHLKTIPAEEYANWKPHYVIHIRTPLDQDEQPATNGTTAGTILRKDELDYLVSIAKEPFLKVTERDQVLGLAKSKGDRLRKALIAQGLLNAVAINPGGGRGRRFKLLGLTKAGNEQLRAFGVSVPSGRGRGGLAHQWWANEIVTWLRSKKLAPVVEDESRGVRVDVAVLTSRGSLAIEVETSPGHELENIRKDLGAGFQEVVCLAKSDEQARTVEERVIGELSQSEVSRVRIGCLTEYRSLLDNVVS